MTLSITVLVCTIVVVVAWFASTRHQSLSESFKAGSKAYIIAAIPAGFLGIVSLMLPVGGAAPILVGMLVAVAEEWIRWVRLKLLEPTQGHKGVIFFGVGFGIVELASYIITFQLGVIKIDHAGIDVAPLVLGALTIEFSSLHIAITRVMGVAFHVMATVAAWQMLRLSRFPLPVMIIHMMGNGAVGTVTFLGLSVWLFPIISAIAVICMYVVSRWATRIANFTETIKGEAKAI